MTRFFILRSAARQAARGLAGLLAVLMVVLSGPGITASDVSTKADFIEVAAPVELALIIAGLSDLDRESNTSIDRRSDYFQAVERHFEPVLEHPIFDALGSEFNLPRLAGNAADFVFDETGRLTQVDTHGSLWGDDEDNLFRNHLVLIQDFAEAGRFQAFFQENQARYRRLIDATARATQHETMLAWLNGQYEASQGGFRMFISPLLSGFHWTTMPRPEPRIWVNPVDPDTVASMTPVETMNYTRAVFTELDHQYINPISATLTKEIETAFTPLDGWAEPGALAAYSTAELVFNEYMTWAVFLLFAADRMPEETFMKYKPGIVDFMQFNRGFSRFGEFTEHALSLFTEEDISAEDLQPRMIEWVGKVHRSSTSS